jgi:hypothetical protein
LPPPSTLKTEAAGSTRQYFTTKNAFITAVTLIQICCNRRAISELAKLPVHHNQSLHKDMNFTFMSFYNTMMHSTINTNPFLLMKLE